MDGGADADMTGLGDGLKNTGGLFGVSPMMIALSIVVARCKAIRELVLVEKVMDPVRGRKDQEGKKKRRGYQVGKLPKLHRTFGFFLTHRTVSSFYIHLY